MNNFRSAGRTAKVGRRAVAVALLGISLAAGADTLLTPHTAEYKVKISVLGGQLNTELKAATGGYVATHQVRATGMARIFAGGEIVERAEFASTPDGIRPDVFRTDDGLTRDKTRATIAFDWDLGEARGTINDQAVSFPMDGIAYDRVSIQYELMYDLMNGGPASQYVLYDVDEIKVVNVQLLGTKSVVVPAGRYDAIVIEHRTEGSKRVTTMWCVAELDYLPVIIEQHRKGKLTMRAVLNSYSPTSS